MTLRVVALSVLKFNGNSSQSVLINVLSFRMINKNFLIQKKKKKQKKKLNFFNPVID